jgi:uncharacterized protein YdcH (DUF465 family)
MNNQHPYPTLELAVLPDAATQAIQLPPPTIIVHQPLPKRLLAGTLVAVLLLTSVLLYGLNTWYATLRDSQTALRHEIHSLRQQSLAEAGRTSELVNLWQENLRHKDENIAALQQEKSALAVELAATRAALAERARLSRRPATPNTPTPRPTPPVQTAQSEPANPPAPIEPVPSPEPNPTPTVTAKLDPPPPPKRNRFVKALRHPIFLDSAVLATSLFVPPSLPLTLAQSRLGRTLTRRVLKKTDTDKTVAGRVATSVTDMPITQKRRR